MFFKTAQSQFLTIALFTALLAISGRSLGQRNIPLHKPENVSALQAHDANAQSYVGKNLNRFGLDKLKTYDLTLDSAFATEMADTLALMEKQYLKSSAAIQTNLTNQKNTIESLTKEKAELKTKYDKLLRTAAISFGVWLLITFIFIQLKKGRVRKQEEELKRTDARFLTIQSNAGTAQIALSKIKQSKNTLLKLKEDAEHLFSSCKEIEDDPAVGDKWNTQQISNAQKILTDSQREFRIMSAIMTQDKEFSEEKEPTDLNKLCEEYVEIVSRGIAGNETDFEFQITKDFEKNLPSIKVNQAALGNLIISVLDNAYQSVAEKAKQNIKGFQPKIAISTRILPRFLQIRIRDNGTGMPANVLDHSTDEFFSTRENGKGAGLGLSESKRILTELHKGELKIESENGNSTDVYIKLFI